MVETTSFSSNSKTGRDRIGDTAPKMLYIGTDEHGTQWLSVGLIVDPGLMEETTTKVQITVRAEGPGYDY
jgi:hypothetical protein